MKNRTVTLFVVAAAFLMAPFAAMAETVAITALSENPKPHGMSDDVRSAFVKHFTAAGFTVVDIAKVDAANVPAKMDAAAVPQKPEVARSAAKSLGADYLVTGNVASNGSAGLISTFTFGANAGQQGEGKPFNGANSIDGTVKSIVANILSAIRSKNVN